MEILVLKTNIEIGDLPRLKLHFDKIPTIQKWAIDFDDCDHVLRIESLVKIPFPLSFKKLQHWD